jgi:hypothetical protein
MSTITVVNNTKLPIHCATSWSHVIQKFRNNVAPGEQIDLPSEPFGWQDFMVVTGSPENEISHDKDWLAVLGLGATVLGTLGTIAGVVALPLTGGASAVLAAGGWAVAATAGGVAASAIATVAGFGVIAGDLIVNPATVGMLWCPDGYTMTVTGGDIEVETKPDGKLYVTNIQPLTVHWINKTSSTHGVSTSKR